MTIVLIGGYGPSIGDILTLGLSSGLRLDLSSRKMVTLAIAAAVIFSQLTLRYLAGNIPNHDILTENLTFSAPIILTALAAGQVGGWVISSAVSRIAEIRA